MITRAKAPAAVRYGVAAVELAIVASFILIPTAYGMIEMSRAVQVKDCLTDAARSGCRVAVRIGTQNSDVTSQVNTTLTANGISTSIATITILVNGVASDVSSASAGDKISVKVAVPAAAVNWMMPLFMANASVESETLVMMRQG